MRVVYILELFYKHDTEWTIESVHESRESAVEKLKNTYKSDIVNSYISEWIIE